MSSNCWMYAGTQRCTKHFANPTGSLACVILSTPELESDSLAKCSRMSHTRTHSCPVPHFGFASVDLDLGVMKEFVLHRASVSDVVRFLGDDVHVIQICHQPGREQRTEASLDRPGPRHKWTVTRRTSYIVTFFV